MVQIEKADRRIKWHRIKADYVAGVSQRTLSAKYHVSRDAIAKHCRVEGWTNERKKAQAEVTQKVIQKTAESTADNATIAARIKTKLLRKLEKEIDALPDMIGSESRNTFVEKDSNKGKHTMKEVTKAYKLRDLAAAYKDLTADMITTENITNPLLQSLYELERRCQGD